MSVGVSPGVLVGVPVVVFVAVAVTVGVPVTVGVGVGVGVSAMQWDGWPEQTKPGSIWHPWSQPSPLSRLPSSHVSWSVSMTLFPQVLGRHSSFSESVSLLASDVVPRILRLRLAFLNCPDAVCFSGTTASKRALHRSFPLFEEPLKTMFFPWTTVTPNPPGAPSP